MPSSADRQRREAAFDFIVACLRPAVDFDPARGAWQLGQTSPGAIVAAADHHGVAGAVYSRVGQLAGAPAELLDPLRERVDGALRHHLHILWELARLQRVMEASGTPWAVLKGPVLAELLYAPGERSYGDLDVLVPPQDFGSVLTAVVDGGSRILDRNWKVMRREPHGEVHLELPGGSLLDLHWDIVNIYRGQVDIDTAAVLGRRERVDLGGVEVPTLDPTDSVIQLSLHGTLSGGDRLRWVHDVARSVASRPPDWEKLTARTHAWRADAPVGYLLLRARDVLGAEIPAGLPERLLGRRYVGLVRITDRLAPWQRAQGRLTSPSLALTRSMAFGPMGAVAWLARRGVASLDPRQPDASSTFRPGGGPEELNAYLRVVAARGKRR